MLIQGGHPDKDIILPENLEEVLHKLSVMCTIYSV
jgi:hypothetical protein